MNLIGRKHEIMQLQDFYNSGRAEFVALYGRRRVGKTFLIDYVVREALHLKAGDEAVFVSPTGKAAANLVKNGTIAGTVHSLIYMRDGDEFDVDEKIAEVRGVCERSPGGLTSIYADLRDGRKTEVDTISGSVVRASRRNGVPAPTHEAMVALVHAMEGKAAK